MSLEIAIAEIQVLAALLSLYVQIRSARRSHPPLPINAALPVRKKPIGFIHPKDLSA
jgi:hypothetical protein